jgi:hypothetical protein
VITYAAINLTNKKFQVGSTVDFGQRCKGHMKGDMNPEFNRALQKHPENFYWIVSEDDGLGTRDEEQYYLDFYHGTLWCYNLNPSATEPPSQEGTCWWNNGIEQVKVFECPGEGWVLGRLGKWWNNGVKNRFGMHAPGEGWVLGRIQVQSTADRQSSSGKGNVWWNNGTISTRAKQCPGEGWTRGRIYRRKS